jgi:hypothetical protein
MNLYSCHAVIWKAQDRVGAWQVAWRSRERSLAELWRLETEARLKSVELGLVSWSIIMRSRRAGAAPSP